MSPPPSMGFRTFADESAADDAAATALPPAAGRLSRRSFLIVLAFASLLLLPALGGRFRVLTQHEVFAAQTAREMLDRGDWVIPHFAGVPRLNKPPGMYYLIAASMSAFQSRAEWVARLPAAAAAVATVLLVAWLAGRWLGDAAGRVAGLMQATFAYVLMQARLAEADMPLCAAVAVAMTAFAAAEVTDEARTRPARRAWLAFAFGTAAGASVALKGVGILFVLAGCLLWVVATRRWRALRFLAHPAGMIPLIALAGAWPLAAYHRDPAILGVWYRETLGRAGGAFDDPDPWHIYLWSVPMLLLPWLPFAAGGLIDWWRRARDGRHTLRLPADIPRVLADRPRAAFLACWFAGGMTLLLFSQARHKHYAIPMLPPVTLLAASGFARWGLAARRPRVAAAACFGTALVGGLAYQLLVLPRFDDYRASADLARRANALVPPGEPVHLVRLGESQLAYYLDRPLVRVDRVSRREGEPRSPLETYLATTDRRALYVLCPEGTTATLGAFGQVTELSAAAPRRRSERERTVLVRLER